MAKKQKDKSSENNKAEKVRGGGDGVALEL